VIEGRELCNDVGGLSLNDKGEDEIQDFAAFKQKIQKLKVIARAVPEVKRLLVVGLRQMGHNVAVTADGTSDLPAVEKATVSFAMGMSATDMCK